MFPVNISDADGEYCEEEIDVEFVKLPVPLVVH